MLVRMSQKRSKHSGQLAVVLTLVIIPVLAMVSWAVETQDTSEQPQMVQMADIDAVPCGAGLACPQITLLQI